MDALTFTVMITEESTPVISLYTLNASCDGNCKALTVWLKVNHLEQWMSTRPKMMLYAFFR